MDFLTTITPNFQVHIPIAIREKLGLKEHGPAIIKTENRKIIIEPIKKDFLSLAGKYKVKQPISAEKIRDHIDYS